MKLGLSQIKEITLGAARVEENENGIQFFRFTKGQEEAYANFREDFYFKRQFATAGVKFRFRTNSENLYLKAFTVSVGIRRYYSFDVLVNGKLIDSLNNFPHVVAEDNNYIEEEYTLGECSKRFNLGKGEKEVFIYLPWSVNAYIKEFELDDNSFVKPVKPCKKLICFGDSITHGVDALYPSNKYTSLLAEMLEAEEYNKAISGDRFFPELAASADDFEPDYITVAYGTNDWARSTREEFLDWSKRFYQNLSRNYPNSKIIGLTPIWRKDTDERTSFVEFEKVSDIIFQQTKGLKNVTILNGYDFVPHDENNYADLRLHPNDKGFRFYFENLAEQLKGII